jgi:hypothetical protein
MLILIPASSISPSRFIQILRTPNAYNLCGKTYHSLVEVHWSCDCKIMVNREGTLKALKKYLEHEVKAVITGEGHRKPCFEFQGRNIIYDSDIM